MKPGNSQLRKVVTCFILVWCMAWVLREWGQGLVMMVTWCGCW